MTTDLTHKWNNTDRADKLEIIENAIEMCNVNEGFLMLRFFKKSNSIAGYITDKLDNHLCEEAVSQATLSELFSADYDFEEEDAEVILKWMDSQK